MKVKIKKLHPDAVIPKYAKEGDAGMDLVGISKTYDTYGNVSFNTGLAFQIPEGYVGYIFPRSSIAKYELTLSNSVGVVDSGYRGEITVKFKHSIPSEYSLQEGLQHEYEVGERIAQMVIMPVPYVDFVEVDELTQSERGEGAYGSTGK